MRKPLKSYAFIDSQNVNLAIRDLGWKLDFRKFRIYLKEKHSVERAYLFIGFLEENADLYTSLQSAGYILVFKPTFRNKEGIVKGNVDAELVLQAMIELKNYARAVIVSGDGDFHCLVKYLREKGKLKCVLIPNQHRYSSLLKKAAEKQLVFMNDLRKRLAYRGKATESTRSVKPPTRRKPAPPSPSPKSMQKSTHSSVPSNPQKKGHHRHRYHKRKRTPDGQDRQGGFSS